MSEGAAALRALQERIRWKPGKAAAHLAKRKALGHLPLDCSVEEYEDLIRRVVHGEEHLVYVYSFGVVRYYAVRGSVEGVEWLVIFTKEGVVETAFPPGAMEEYLAKRGFVLVGTVREMVG